VDSRPAPRVSITLKPVMSFMPLSSNPVPTNRPAAPPHLLQSGFPSIATRYVR
jgi:hypothetical protein